MEPRRASSSPASCCCSACSVDISPCARCARPSARSSARANAEPVVVHGHAVRHPHRAVLRRAQWRACAVRCCCRRFTVSCPSRSSAPRRSSAAMRPDPSVARVFYVWLISVMNLLLVSVFWSFMLEHPLQRTIQAAVRLHRGGRERSAALLGPGARRCSSRASAIAGVLYLGAACTWWPSSCRACCSRMARTSRPRLRSGAALGRERALGGNPFAGFMLVLRNRYLLGIALFDRGHLGHQHLPVLRAARTGGAEVRGARGAHAGVRAAST